MPNIILKGDKVTGSHLYEKFIGNDDDGNPMYEQATAIITGEVATASSNVFINGKGVARKGDTTNEYDVHDNGSGIIITGNSSILINGLPIARDTDTLKTHKGTGNIIASNNTIKVD